MVSVARFGEISGAGWGYPLTGGRSPAKTREASGSTACQPISAGLSRQRLASGRDGRHGADSATWRTA